MTLLYLIVGFKFFNLSLDCSFAINFCSTNVWPDSLTLVADQPTVVMHVTPLCTSYQWSVVEGTKFDDLH